jgi:CheY-like chemotaxis protein
MSQSGPSRPARNNSNRDRSGPRRGQQKEAPAEVEIISSLPPEPGILVVDDDRAVRGMLTLLLPRHGFTVWAAASGQAAVDLYAQRQEQIDLVLLDVSMPDLDGPQTLRALRGINPQVRCCFMSGYGGVYTDQELLGMGAIRFFAKPFRLSELVRELREVLGPAEDQKPVVVRKALRRDPASPPGAERRAQIRYLCQLKNSCQLVGRLGAGESWPGIVRNLSAGGLQVLLQRRYEPGTILAVEIPPPDGDDSATARRLLARVVRVMHEPDGQWALGCSFMDGLDDNELRDLLA